MNKAYMPFIILTGWFAKTRAFQRTLSFTSPSQILICLQFISLLKQPRVTKRRNIVGIMLPNFLANFPIFFLNIFDIIFEGRGSSFVLRRELDRDYSTKVSRIRIWKSYFNPIRNLFFRVTHQFCIFVFYNNLN